MSDLEAFRDHCRRMSRGEGPDARASAMLGLLDADKRAEWTRLADEADAYLSHFQDDAMFEAAP